MAPPLPPPGVPCCAGLPPLPIARLCENRLLMMVHETPMLLMPPPFEHDVAEPSSPPNVLFTT
jgi:hypothetical protein